MPAPALTTLLLPDPLLAGTGQGVISSYTQADGLTADVGVPYGSNEGGLMVTQSGTPTAKVDQGYRIIASGGVWGQATWAHKLQSVAEQDKLPTWKGENDLRYVWATHWPFSNVTPLPAVPGTGRPKAAAWIPSLNREIVYHIDSNYIWVAYRDVTVDQHQYADQSGDASQWVIDRCTRTDSTPGSFMGARSANASGFGIETLRDGELIMVIEDESNTDFDVYMSEDGISWKPVADQILARFSLYGRDNNGNYIEGFRMAVSGDYIMVSFVWIDTDDIGGNGVVSYVRSLVSSDRGASWIELSALDNNERPYQLGNNQWKWRYDIAGVGDDAGSFMLFIGNGETPSRTTTRVATRTGLQAWSFDSSFNVAHGAASQPFGIWAARGPQYVYVFYVIWDAPSTEWDIRLTLIDPRNYAKLSGWKDVGNILNGRGTYNYMWHNMRFANVGGMYLACCTDLIDSDADKSTPTYSPVGVHGGYFRIGGWDSMPVEERHHPELKEYPPPYRHQPGQLRSETGGNPWRLPYIEWNAWSGSPDPGATDSAAATPWTNPASTLVTPTWNGPNSYQLIDAGVGTRQHEIRWNDAAPTYSLMGSTSTSYGQCGHMLEVIVKVNTEPLGIHTLRPRIGVEVNGYDVGAGTAGQHTYYVHFSTTQAALYDAVAAAWVVAPVNVASMTEQFHKFRVGALSQPYKSGDPVDVSFWHRSEEASGSDWTLLGTGRLESTTGAVQDIYWGHLYGQVTGNRDSEWRRVAIYGPHDGGATRNITDAWGDITGGVGNDDKFWDNLRGRAITNDQVYVREGISAEWGGGGGHENDLYSASTIEAFAPSNILGIGSPTTGYRSLTPSSGTTSAAIVYDAAAPDTETNQRYHHHGFAAFGYSSEQLSVEYSDDNFSSITAAHTIDFNRWTGRVEAVGAGNQIQVAFGVDGPAIGEEISGQGAMAHYLRFTLGTTYFPDQCFRVIRSGEYGSSRSLRLDSDVDLSVLSAGASFTIFSDRGAVLYDAPVIARYMRLAMPNTSTAYGNQHRLGHFTAGLTLPLSVALEWHYTDAENPNTTEYTTTGAKRWAYQNGPAQRVLETRMTGDIVELRQRIRRYFRVFTHYDLYPLTMILDPGQLNDPERLFLGCVKSGAELTEYGQRYDSATSRWVTVGDMKLKVYEEV